MNREVLRHEIVYRATRSSGPGGQHVNKTSTRVELYWDLEASEALSKPEKERLRVSLAKLLNKDGLLMITASPTRSQMRNKQAAEKKFISLLEKALIVPKKRKAPRGPSAQAKAKRLRDKRMQSERKAGRRKVQF
ncbi:MAG: alternative ribosome rescue aminoacyl-tRNA hydrolase ArfB [Bacteroidota bacterium]